MILIQTRSNSPNLSRPISMRTASVTSKICLFLAILFLAATSQGLGQDSLKWDPDETGLAEVVTPFMQKHCAECHQGSTAEADLSIDDLPNDFFDRAGVARWSEVVDVLNSHEMPPEDSPQPNVDDTAEVVDWITSQIVRAELLRRENSVIMRRLNVDEYRRTINDLFGIDYDTSHFPEDPPAGGFDNNGGALSLSPLHLELYYESARDILDQVINVGDRPKTIEWRFQPESGDSDSNRVRYDGQNLIVNGGKNKVSDGFKVMHHVSWDRNLNVRPFKVPAEGEYVIRIRAAAVIPTRDEVIASAEKFLRDRRDREDAKQPDRKRWHQEQYETDLEHFRNDPMYDYGPPRLKLIQHLGGQPKVLAEFDVDAPLSDPKVYEVRARFTEEHAGITIEYAYSIPRELENFWFQTSDEFARPELWVDWFELQGPVIEPWPNESHARLFADTRYESKAFPFEPDDPSLMSKRKPSSTELQQDTAEARQILANFMPRAFRRPISDKEVDEKLELFVTTRQQGETFSHSIRLPLISILMSPHFLFMAETLPDSRVAESTTNTNSNEIRKLTSFELASRLSYFLWSTMPDQHLIDLAARDKLIDPAILNAEVDRMLKDPKARALADNFAAQWLGVRDVGANPPASDLFPRYDVHLENSMKEEPKAFFMEVLKHDLPLTSFIKSDFVVINERLGRFYSIPNVSGDSFRRVAIPADVHRGGVMTQGAMLTITSNGTRTSPVKRGTWLLENVLGISPGLPVANAGEIAPKVPGINKATVRVRLEAHRELPQCARCHSKIDPLGFALENYDGSGRWREKEGFGYKGRIGRDDPEIDASSKLPDGTVIDGIEDLQQALLTKKDQFYECLAKKLTSYAIGREIAISDQPEIDQIIDESTSDEETLRNMIIAIVQSELFLTK